MLPKSASFYISLNFPLLDNRTEQPVSKRIFDVEGQQ